MFVFRNHRVSWFSVLALIAVAAACAATWLQTALLGAEQARGNARFDYTRQHLYTLCVRREYQERALRALERADVRLQLTMTAIERLDTSAPAVLRERRIQAFRQKLTIDRRYLATRIEDGCEKEAHKTQTTS